MTLWMEIVARNWLVWELTESLAAVGWVNFWRTIPVLFLAIPAGVFADRFSRKKILVFTQIGILIIYIILVILLLRDTLQLWQVYTLFAARGAMIAFNQPGRQALIPAIVGRDKVPNAVALQQFSFNGTRIIAPILTGILFETVGPASVFIVIVILEFGIIGAWLLMRSYPHAARAVVGPAGIAGALKDTMDGLRYVRGNSSILLLLLLGLISLLFLQPFMVLLPEIADSRFDIGSDWLVMVMNDAGLGFIVGATLFGTFLTFMGIGSIMGPTFLAYLGNVSNKGALVVGSMALSGVALAALGAAPWLVLALAVMVVLGMLDSSQRVITNSLLLTQTDSEFHGRVISLYLLDRGFVPIGSLVAGYMGVYLGPAAALAILGGGLTVSVLIVAAIRPSFLRVR